VKFRLIPTDDAFFRLFNEAAANVSCGARALQELLADRSAIADHFQQIVTCEHQGDDLTRSILRRLDTTFVTPFDREDIHALAEELDDVVDDMLAAAALLNLVHVDEILPELKEQADVLVQMADCTVELVARLESMRGVESYLDTIDRLETEGDQIYRRAVARLFGGEFEALDVIRWKDVVQAMEEALNTIEDISNVVETIVLKFA
jgi:predicted phosphate transport protein (TIGR00153 family)